MDKRTLPIIMALSTLGAFSGLDELGREKVFISGPEKKRCRKCDKPFEGRGKYCVDCYEKHIKKK